MFDPIRRPGRIVAIAGGKGGVGKSLISLNLAITLGRLGYHTTLIDGDLGSPNLHTLLGIAKPGPGLGGFFEQDGAALAEFAHATDIANLTLVPGSARVGAANLNAAQTVRLVQSISDLTADVVLLDVGAGSAFSAIDLVAAADLKVVVMTPQLTSIQNAYAFMKACVQRLLRRLPEDADARHVLQGLLSGPRESLPIQRAVSVLRDDHPELAHTVVDVLDRFGTLLVGNMLTSEKDHTTLSRISAMISDYLMIKAPLVAELRMSDDVRKSVDNRTPIAMSDHARDTVSELRRLARVVIDADVKRLRTTRQRGGEHLSSAGGERDASPGLKPLPHRPNGLAT